MAIHLFFSPSFISLGIPFYFSMPMMIVFCSRVLTIRSVHLVLLFEKGYPIEITCFPTYMNFIICSLPTSCSFPSLSKCSYRVLLVVTSPCSFTLSEPFGSVFSSAPRSLQCAVILVISGRLSLAVTVPVWLQFHEG